MASFGWQSPWPRRFGGNAHQRIATMLATVRSARPDMLTSTGDESEVDAKNQVMARALVTGLAANERRVAQADPRRLTALVRPVTFPDGRTEETSILARWEKILGLKAQASASEYQRRQAVWGALVSTTSARRSSVETAMQGVFGSWYVGLGENDTADVDYPGKSPAGNVTAYWPTAQAATPDTFHDAEYPGRYSPTDAWRSNLCHIAVLFQPPASADPGDVNRARGKALQLLDDMLPAWMSATVSQLAPGSTASGFYLGVSYLGLTAL